MGFIPERRRTQNHPKAGKKRISVYEFLGRIAFMDSHTLTQWKEIIVW